MWQLSQISTYACHYHNIIIKPFIQSLELPEFGEVYLKVLMEEMKRRRMEMEVLGKGEESVNGENNKDWDGTVSTSARLVCFGS